MKIKERLDYFLAKIAGEEVDLSDINPPVPVTTTEKLLDKIAEEGVSSTLPAVTSDDDGDVLTVVDGEWAKAEAPSGGDGGGAFVINAASGTMDKTWQEIYDAVDAGKVCAVKIASVEGQAAVEYVSTIFEYQIDTITASLGGALVTSYVATTADDYPAIPAGE